MIKDSLMNANKYDNLSVAIKKGLKYLIDTDFAQIEDGKHLIDGDDLYVNIQTYTTKSDADFEAHRRYVDIQYIIAGQENIMVTEYSTCRTTIPYEEQKDIEFLSGDGTNNIINDGEFMILYPNDAHKPSISVDKNNPITVRKAVVKVLI